MPSAPDESKVGELPGRRGFFCIIYRSIASGLIFLHVIALAFTSTVDAERIGCEKKLVDLAKDHFLFSNFTTPRENAFVNFFQNVEDGKKNDLCVSSMRSIPAEWIEWLCKGLNASAKVITFWHRTRLCAYRRGFKSRTLKDSVLLDLLRMHFRWTDHFE